MVTIRFPDLASKRLALGFLADRLSFASWASGEMAVPDEAVGALSREAILFEIEGRAEVVPDWAEVLEKFERSETHELADAFAQLAGIDRMAWDQRVAEHKAKWPAPGDGR